MTVTWMRNLLIRRVVLFLADVAIVTVAYAFAYWLRLDMHARLSFADYAETFWRTLPLLLVIRFACGLVARQYTWAFRLASLPEAAGLAKAVAAGTLLFYLARHGLWQMAEFTIPVPPRSVYAIEFLVTLLGFTLLRFGPRYLYQRYARRSTRLLANGEARLRTLIYGAGHTGELILRDILRTRIYPYHVVGFVDDNPAKWNTSIHGHRVFGPATELPRLIPRHRIDKLLVAIPDIPAAQLRTVVEVCSDHHVRFKAVPRIADMMARGDALGITLKDLQLEDLLDRTPVTFDHSRMAEFFVDRTILVTGAAGSIGSEICRQVVQQGATRLVILDMNENDSYLLSLELKHLAPNVDVCVEIANIRDETRLRILCDRYQPQIVFHAAAHKHVPLVERAPAEGLKNNVLGTLYAARAAQAAGVERFVLISTDKAVRPSSVMGATKRLAELVVRHLDRAGRTRFLTVRFGNVLGSSGSLVQILRRQIERGGPVTITHPNITRYFMTIPEAVGLVLVAAVRADGPLCVLDMGQPMKVDRLARQMISLAGLIPDKDIPIVYIGLRPGEKMTEELYTTTERQRPSSHPRIHLADCSAGIDRVDQMIVELHKALEDGTAQAVREFLKRYVPDYRPWESGDASRPPDATPAVRSTPS